jgi:hypothetical protein
VRRRRDRRERGVRGGIAPAGSPTATTRAERFDDLVVAAVDRLEARWGPRLGSLDVEVHEVPAYDPAATDVVLAAHRRATASRPAAVVVYRRPVELRAPDRLARQDLVRDLVAEQLAALLGVSPTEVDPAYDDPDLD